MVEQRRGGPYRGARERVAAWPVSESCSSRWECCAESGFDSPLVRAKRFLAYEEDDPGNTQI